MTSEPQKHKKLKQFLTYFFKKIKYLSNHFKRVIDFSVTLILFLEVKMKNNLNYKLLTKKHSFWESLDSCLKGWLIAIAIGSVTFAIPFGLGNLSFVQKIIYLMEADISPKGCWGRYGIGWLALLLLIVSLMISYAVLFLIASAVHVFVAKLILSVRYTRLPLSEQEFNEAFKDKDIIETMQMLTDYMTFTRIDFALCKVFIYVRNKHSVSIENRLYELIYKKFKNLTYNEWLQAFEKAKQMPFISLSTGGRNNSFADCFDAVFWYHSEKKLISCLNKKP